ncbi:MAG: PQQ-like beta-propeller repeat protein, partial [Deltaproteobacteria bacterium]|nr:PQQ-like beta-propeller repeat protein [Deltaproteobacteria bacterium]
TVLLGGDKEIGGRTDVCVDGECLFNYGIRIFFLLDYQGTGQGFTVALINGTDNDKTSIGGNENYPEFLGYAGDGLLSGGSSIPGTTPELYPPKMALEFDTYTNFFTNDPLSNNKDVLQYVFWGSSVTDSFDDNRHNTGGSIKEWVFPTGGNVESSPAIAIDTDDTIYVGSNDKKLYAINPDGTEKWNFPTGDDVKSSPAVGSDGTIYVGSNDDKLYAINPVDGSKKWEFITGGNVESSPLIGSDGNIYVGSDDDKIYVIDPDGTKIKSFTTSDNVRSSPGVGLNGAVYVGSNDNKIYALGACNPRNIKDNYYTYDNLPAAEQARIIDDNNWLNRVQDGNIVLWAVRMEVKRSQVANADGNYEYTLRTWIRQCTEADCSDIIGTYFQDTRIEYGAKSPHIEQTIELCPDDHTKFDSFLFGLTEATSAETQTVVISNLQLGFIRPGDFVITEDTDWPP